MVNMATLGDFKTKFRAFENIRWDWVLATPSLNQQFSKNFVPVVGIVSDF